MGSAKSKKKTKKSYRKTTEPTKCKICGEPNPPGQGGNLRHYRDTHPEEWLAEQRANQKKATDAKELKQAKLLAEAEALVAIKREKAAAKAAKEAGPAGAVITSVEESAGETHTGGNGVEPKVEVVLASDMAKTGTLVVKPIKTDDYRQASVFAYVPKVFQFSSVLIGTMKYITEKEWGWPEMSFDDWIDTYLYYTAQALGVRLMAYEIEKPDNPQRGGNHDGERAADPGDAAIEGLAARYGIT